MNKKKTEIFFGIRGISILFVLLIIVIMGFDAIPAGHVGVTDTFDWVVDITFFIIGFIVGWWLRAKLR